MTRPAEPMPEHAAAAPPERLTSIDALRGFDMFWIVGGDEVARALCRWWGTPGALRLCRSVRARRLGGLPLLRPDLPALPLPGRRRPAVLAAEVSPTAPIPGARPWAARRGGSCCCSCSGWSATASCNSASTPCGSPGSSSGSPSATGWPRSIFLFTRARTQLVVFIAILVGYWALLTFVPSPESSVPATSPARRTSPATSTAISCPARSTKPTTATATTRGCSRRSRRWPRRSWACWPATGCSRTAAAGPRPRGLAAAGLACLGRARSGAATFPSSRTSGPARSCWSRAAGACSCWRSSTRSSTCSGSAPGRSSSS